MNNTTKIILIAVVVGLVGFYGGMKYGQSKTGPRMMGGNFTRGANGMLGGNRGGQNASFVSGEVVSKDAGSLTLKLRDGSSKIVLTATSTAVMKSTSGSSADLEPGTQVTVTGSSNQDGSINAQSIQIRPASSTMPMMPIRQ